MIELRQRSRTPSGSGYVPLSSDDEGDEIPVLNVHKFKKLAAVTPKSNFCPKCCCLFSIIAIIFLAIVALLLWQDSLYFKVNAENQNKKRELVNGVLGAIMMYVVCVGLSGYMWLKSAMLEPMEAPRFDD